MAMRTANQSTGDIGEGSLQLIFKLCGYACSDIDPDFGEDFFVFSQAGEEIEPFKIFVQSKASTTFDSVESDWTEYENSSTVRNWVLSNELTIVIRQNFVSGEARYCIPEEEIQYWELDYTKPTPVRLLKKFDHSTVEYLIWRARIRHYYRLVQITRPSEFDKDTNDEVSSQRKFIAEFLVRIGVLQQNLHIADQELSIYNTYLGGISLTVDFVDADDMSLHETLRYIACVMLVVYMVDKVSGPNQGLSKQFADDCAALLVQFIIEDENLGRVMRPRSDDEWKSIRRNFLKSFVDRQDATPVLTEWYPSATKPINSGAYQRNDENLYFFSIWHNDKWYGRFDSFDVASLASLEDQNQNLPWRGIPPMSNELGNLIKEQFLGTNASAAIGDAE